MGETKNEYKKGLETARTETSRERRLHGKFKIGVTEVAGERSWQSLKPGYLGKSTKGCVFAAQEQALQTRFFRASIEKDVD